MKIYTLLIISLPILSFSSNIDMKKIVAKIEALKNNVNISASVDYKVYDPFARAKPILNEKVKRIRNKKIYRNSSIVIQTILNNKVLINGKWFKVGDKVQGATIKNINENNIMIYKNNKWLKVSFKRKKDIIKIKNGVID